MILLVLLLMALQVGDVLTTLKILQNGRELNPLMNWLFIKLGMKEVLLAKAVVVSCIGIWLWTVYPIVLIPLCVLYIGVVGWNSYQILKLK